MTASLKSHNEAHVAAKHKIQHYMEEIKTMKMANEALTKENAQLRATCTEMVELQEENQLIL
jgi:hypothetical protein